MSETFMIAAWKERVKPICADWKDQTQFLVLPDGGKLATREQPYYHLIGPFTLTDEKYSAFLKLAVQNKYRLKNPAVAPASIFDKNGDVDTTVCEEQENEHQNPVLTAVSP